MLHCLLLVCWRKLDGTLGICIAFCEIVASCLIHNIIRLYLSIDPLIWQADWSHAGVGGLGEESQSDIGTSVRLRPSRLFFMSDSFIELRTPFLLCGGNTCNVEVI